MTDQRRIWAATQSPLFGAAIEGFLRTLPGARVTGYPFQDALLSALGREELPDLLVLHQLLPGPHSPLDFLRRVRAAAPELRVIYLAVEGPRLEEVLQELIAAGIYDFLTGRFHPSELAQLIEHPRSRADVRHLERQSPAPGAPGAPGGRGWGWRRGGARGAGGGHGAPGGLGGPGAGGNGGAPGGSSGPGSPGGPGTEPPQPATRVLPAKVVAFWGPCRAGTSTLLANLAALLAMDPDLRVVAVDFNLIAPSLGLMLDAFGEANPYDHCMTQLLPELEGDRLTPDRLESYLLEVPRVPGLKLFPGLFHPLALPRFREEHAQRILQMLRERYHLVLVDLPPALDFITTFPTLDTAQQVFALFTPHYPTRFHLKRYLLHLPEFGWELDRFTLVCNDARRIRPESLREELGRPVGAVVPHLPEMAAWVERGEVPALAAVDPEQQVELFAYQQGLDEVARCLFSRVQMPSRRSSPLRAALNQLGRAGSRIRRLLPARPARG